MRDQFARAGLLALLVFALVEVGAHAATRARVPATDDWRAAAQFVRDRKTTAQVVTVAPTWADPLLRQALGDEIDLAAAGRSDLAAYSALWALTIRGADVREAPSRAPELVQQFGGVTVKRWALGASLVRYDFVENVRRATVTWRRRDGDRDCPWQRSSPGRRAGLGVGALHPAQSFACDRSKPWLWVAPIVLEDLDLQPRRCVWQHPAGDEPVVTRFEDVPLGERLVFYGGLYYEHERMRQGGPVEARIRIDDRLAATFTHVDGDGWKPLVVPTGGNAQSRGDVAIEVTATRPHKRSFCWSATTRAGERQGER